MTTAISQIMTRDVTVVAPTDDMQHAARMMADWHVGVLPVCDGKRLVGMLTDRDIAVRGVPTGKAPADIRVSEVMTANVQWCFDDQTVGEILQAMGDAKVRRIPVINRNMELVGIVSLGDLAAREKAHTDDALMHISTPSEPVRPGGDAGRADPSRARRH